MLWLVPKLREGINNSAVGEGLSAASTDADLAGEIASGGSAVFSPQNLNSRKVKSQMSDDSRRVISN